MHFSSPHLLLLVVVVLVPQLARASAVLFMYPTEVVFEDNQRSAEITLSNSGDQTGTFEMGWTHMMMTPEGGLMKYDGTPPWSVQPFVRYSPRRVTLPPSESQVIKIALRRGQDVPEGEYYSHFKVLTLRSEDPLADQLESAEPVEGFSITTRSAIAIPIIWRNSRDRPSASIESVLIDADANELNVDVRRDGLLSVRGYLHLLESAPDADGTRSSLAEPAPLVIYPNIDARAATIELNDGVRADSLPSGATLYFSPDEEIDDRSILYASYPVVP